MKNRIRTNGKRGLKPAGAVLLMVAAVLLFSPQTEETAYAAPGYEDIASAADTGGSTEVGKYGMLPVYGRDIKDGVYTISGESSSSFFKIEESELTVKNGELTVKMQIPSNSYRFVYMGTAEEAAAAPIEDYIEPDNKVGISTFEIPLDALDKKIPCAAYSRRKKQWYDRTILFHASDIPAESLLISLPDYAMIEEALKLYEQTNGTVAGGETEAGAEGTQTGANGAGSGTTGTVDEEAERIAALTEPVDVDLEDGTYSIQVNMTGGSGRASVSSPTWMIVKDHKAYARLLWSSSYYDYMLVGGQKYLNESSDGGNSTFTIPITIMEEPMPVVADTTAMGDPVAIDYKLTFYEDSIGSKSQIPQEAAIDVLILAAIIIVAGGILNYFVKKRRKH